MDGACTVSIRFFQHSNVVEEKDSEGGFMFAGVVQSKMGCCRAVGTRGKVYTYST
jgi:hypothetical protein